MQLVGCSPWMFTANKFFSVLARIFVVFAATDSCRYLGRNVYSLDTSFSKRNSYLHVLSRFHSIQIILTQEEISVRFLGKIREIQPFNQTWVQRPTRHSPWIICQQRDYLHYTKHLKLIFELTVWTYLIQKGPVRRQNFGSLLDGPVRLLFSLRSIDPLLPGDPPQMNLCLLSTEHRAAFTLTQSRWETKAKQILKRHQVGKEAAVFGPDFSYCFPPTATQQVHQPAGMDEGIEIHALPNHINSSHEADLKEQKTWLSPSYFDYFHLSERCLPTSQSALKFTNIPTFIVA